MKIAVDEIKNINEILPTLPKTAVQEIRDFAYYLADREKRRSTLVKRVLKAEQRHDSVICHSAQEAVQAILDTPDDDADEA